jgi:hypothetical protein
MCKVIDGHESEDSRQSMSEDSRQIRSRQSMSEDSRQSRN